MPSAGHTLRFALIAHDNKKDQLIEWARRHLAELAKHQLMATGTTGSRLEAVLGLTVKKFKSGPLGGDLQIGACIAEGLVDGIIFFWDPLQPHSHDVDVKALLRIAVVYDVPLACSLRAADLMFSAMTRP